MGVQMLIRKNRIMTVQAGGISPENY